MEIARFTHDQRPYVVAFQNNTNFVVWTEVSDGFQWGQVNLVTERLGQPKNAIRLVRKVWQIVKGFIYDQRLPYFEVSADDDIRAKIYGRFLSSLTGYDHHQYGTSFFVIRSKEKR